jgi:hypothetical protein
MLAGELAELNINPSQSDWWPRYAEAKSPRCVRHWHKADMAPRLADFRFRG